MNGPPYMTEEELRMANDPELLNAAGVMPYARYAGRVVDTLAHWTKLYRERQRAPRGPV